MISAAPPSLSAALSAAATAATLAATTAAAAVWAHRSDCLAGGLALLPVALCIALEVLSQGAGRRASVAGFGCGCVAVCIPYLR